MYDFGCGEKPYEEYFKRFVDRYVGVDWSDSPHTLKADIVADLNKKIPIESETADTIISLSVLEHLFEPQMMLNEAYRILKPDGVMVLQVPFQWWIHEIPYDFFRYTPFGLKYLFLKAGFKHIEIEPSSGFFTMIILKFNYFTSRITSSKNIFGLLMQLALRPFWYIGQVLAPQLDKIDKQWELETSGFYVVARKK